MLITRCLMAAFILMVCWFSPAKASQFEAVENIEHSAYIHSIETLQVRYDNPQVIVEPMDTRLRLRACSNDLTVTSDFTNNGLGSQTVAVKCNAPESWTVYVPIKVKVMKPIAVVTKALSARHVIRSEDVRIELHDIASMRRGYFDDISSVVGMQLKYPVAMGTVLSPSTLVEQKVVLRGQQITLVAVIGNMEVRMSGTALMDGFQGQRVRVKNSSSKRIVEGVVDAPGIVKIIM